MERFAQMLDDFEDLIFAFGLVWESIRTSLRFATFVLAALSTQVLVVVLAIIHPPLAVATATLLLVWLLYQAVVTRAPGKPLST